MSTTAEPLGSTDAWNPRVSRPLDGAKRREVRCAACGYGAVVIRLPRACPMCGGSDWTEIRLHPRAAE